MKSKFTLLIVCLLLSVLTKSQTLFFDDFEEPISNDATFKNWTTENLEGWQYWHIIPGQFMRFENNDLDQNDWLITKKINCAGAENLKVNFSYLYSANKVPPHFYYTKQYNGNASQSTWTELSFSFGAKENQWYSSTDYIIENPGDAIYFAFHYQVKANAGANFLLDNFSVKSYTPLVPFVLVGNSEHFEFYTNFADSKNYFKDLKDALENQYAKFADLWNRPGIENVFSNSDKIKVYYSKREDIDKVTPETPIWKISFQNEEKLELYISPILNSIQESYYSNLQSLAINEFSQLAISKKCGRENYINLPAYFLEGFGLYESGFRPRRDSIVKYLNENPEPNFDFVRDTSGISNSLKKDLIVSNIEGQLLTTWSYLSIGEGASSYIHGQWPKYLNHFYKAPENERIKLLTATANFDFYGTVLDSSNHSEVVSFFENAFSFYKDNYKYSPRHKFNVVICPDDKIGGDLTGWGLLGGAGFGGDCVLQLSPNYNYNEKAYYSDYFGYEGLCAHEFFHIYYNHFMYQIPGGFWAEGSADFSQCHSIGWELPPHSIWEIEDLFTDYKQKYNANINLNHIVSNPNHVLDIYFLGHCFFEYIYLNHGGYKKIIAFFNHQMDYSVFNATYEEIDKGYIKYLKSLVNYIPPDTLLSLPFNEPFKDFSNGWSKPSYINPDNWQIDDKGTNGTNCAMFYIYSYKKLPIKSWLITPPLNTKNLGKAVFSFDYTRNGNGSELEIFYTNKFDGNTEKSNWTSLKKISLTGATDWKNSGEITLMAPPDTLFIGIRYSSPGEQHQQVYVDNFIVKDRATSVREIALNDFDFSVYPNPVTSESIVSFQTTSVGDINLSIFDLQGRKICTLLEGRFDRGIHTVPIVNQIKENGVYFCRLFANGKYDTIKLIVNNRK